MRVLTLVALTGIAGVLAATGKNEQAVELAAFVSYHQASRYETKNQATKVMVDTCARLPSDVAQAAQEKGHNREMEKLVEELLGL